MPTFEPIFARRVEEPLGCAKRELGAGRVREALAALEPKVLAASLRLAIEDVAQAAGAPKAAVEALIEWGPIDMALAALGESRGVAAAVWSELPPIPGGLLAGVAEVTTHADNDDVGFYLDRLGQKMARDRSLSGPIDRLAADVEVWQNLTRSAGRALDEHPRLLWSRKRRLLLRAGAAVAVAAILIPIAVVLVLQWRARRLAHDRVNAALDGTDPCAANVIAPADLATAGEAAQARAAERSRACDEIRARTMRIAKCEALVGAVEQRGTIEGDAADTAGAMKPLLGRMIVRSLDAADLATSPAWPCEEVDGPKRLWKVFIEVAGTSTMLWRDPPPVADDIAARIAEVGLSPASRGTLLGRAEELSGHGVRQGDTASLVRGGELCALCRKLRIDTGPNCRGLDVVRAKSGSAP